MPDYVVVTDTDADAYRTDANNPQEAVEIAVRAWQIFADPGYKFLCFDVKDARQFEFALHVIPSPQEQS